MFWNKKKSELSWQEEAKIESAVFRLKNIMLDCMNQPTIDRLEREIELLKEENDELLKRKEIHI